jgi:hypothetical protein
MEGEDDQLPRVRIKKGKAKTNLQPDQYERCDG